MPLNNKITQRIYLGGVSDVKRLVAEEEIGAICTILSGEEMEILEADEELMRLLRGLGWDWLWIKQPDQGFFKASDIQLFLAWMDGVVRIGKVLVHCGAGMSRSPSLVIAWLMSVGFSWDEAEDFVKTRRYIMPGGGLKTSIKHFFADLEPPPIAIMGETDLIGG